ncbi:hypothetical protein FISHEDRAFT_46841 [Fistulina hepatica ATCC 64428]|uniref:NADH-ubiquinone oxidoreductase 21 kDa subunit n=1 Tax=Fistulina hepatica ATCC 64428 TaxID=1128425 RepID=A0A0D7A8I0_9AGAR|nr:hypothetical protein FISHEDRAFT_46841 [Fistulina hepatica ATCC 64428]
MPLQKAIETPYSPIDCDPHASRVVRYMRTSDIGVWAAGTAGAPFLLGLWNMADPVPTSRVAYRVAGVLGFVGGFLLAYQRSSLRFWGWSENQREQEMDMKELRQLAKEGKPLYGTSDQPEWVQSAAHRNSVYSALKFSAIPMFNFVNHPHHGTDASKYAPEKSD